MRGANRDERKVTEIEGQKNILLSVVRRVGFKTDIFYTGHWLLSKILSWFYIELPPSQKMIKLYDINGS